MKKILFVCLSFITCLHIGQAGNVKEKALPLALQSFSAICNGGKVDLAWKAITGTDNVYYTIEKSKDGKNFTKLMDVQSTGTTVGYRDYVEVDYKPYKGTSYYRLRQTDKNGTYKYSSAVIVTVSFATRKNIKTYSGLLNGDSSLSNHPNENGHDSQEVVIVLRDVQGAEFVSKVLLMMEKNVVFLVDTQKSVPPGNYIITSSSEDKISNYRLTIK
ncbi:MAG TPA: hypothetical protein VNX01_15865 [Bacteroidia bacterium]|nr:hypothetical protein [Bacteroidia bacterium]